MEVFKFLTDKAWSNLHVTLPIGSVVALVVVSVYATSYAKEYENRLTTVEAWGPKIQQVDQVKHNTSEIAALHQAVKDIDTKFDNKFDTFQSDFKELLIGMLGK